LEVSTLTGPPNARALSDGSHDSTNGTAENSNPNAPTPIVARVRNLRRFRSTSAVSTEVVRSSGFGMATSVGSKNETQDYLHKYWTIDSHLKFMDNTLSSLEYEPVAVFRSACPRWRVRTLHLRANGPRLRTAHSGPSRAELSIDESPSGTRDASRVPSSLSPKRSIMLYRDVVKPDVDFVAAITTITEAAEPPGGNATFAPSVSRTGKLPTRNVPAAGLPV